MEKPEDSVLLEVLNIADSNRASNAYALILGDAEGHRHLPVIIGTAEAQSIAIELKGMSVPRPMTHDLFIELVHHTPFILLYVEIYREIDGIYSSHLVYDNEGETFQLDARTSDAVAIALRTGKPIYVRREILERNAVPFHQETDTYELGFDEVDEEALRTQLSEAIKDEDYELAAQLRDKLKQLKS